jgi:hypothetical protein
MFVVGNNVPLVVLIVPPPAVYLIVEPTPPFVKEVIVYV